MDSLGKKAGYLNGLMEGLTFSDPGQEKLMRAMVDLLGELCDRTEDVEDLVTELNDYVESIDDDLSDLEGERAGGFSLLDEDELGDDYLEDEDRASPRLHLIGGGKDGEDADGEKSDGEDDEEEDGDFDGEAVTLGAVACPECNKPFFVSLFDPDGSIYVCPHCGYRGVPNALDASNSPIASPVDEDD